MRKSEARFRKLNQLKRFNLPELSIKLLELNHQSFTAWKRRKKKQIEKQKVSEKIFLAKKNQKVWSSIRTTFKSLKGVIKLPVISIFQQFCHSSSRLKKAPCF